MNDTFRKIDSLLGGVGVLQVRGNDQACVSGIAYHTKDVKEDCLFVAIRGEKFDGHEVVPEAVAAGARVIVAERDIPIPDHVTLLVVKETRHALALISAHWFDDASLEMRLIGITGTNGKTTITYLLESIWQASRHNSGVVGTISYRFGKKQIIAPTTTPQSYDLQCLLREMCNENVTDVAMEVSSHGLAQKRVDGCEFDGAVITNISQDHLDYHASMEEYAAVKRRLFTEVLSVGRKAHRFAVINIDDPVTSNWVEDIPYQVFTYGFSTSADIHPLSEQITIDGINLTLATPRGNLQVESNLLGKFNVSNIMAAVGVGLALRIPAEQISRGISSLTGVPGRLEKVASVNDVVVLVDYAHTPAALENAVSTVRELTSKKLITVFGCGGDRDQKKRPLMGEAASVLSDVVVVTSDNPRTEDPDAIINQIKPGIDKISLGRASSLQVVIEKDRRKAIECALNLARPGDIVLIAGKGHEGYQIVGEEKRHFDDREIARELLENIVRRKSA